MKAAYVNEPGPVESIIIGDLPVPEPTGSQVLVRVGASAVNPVDTYIRSGDIAMEMPLPFIPGCDLAGTVEAVGPDAKKFNVGDRVWGSNQGLLGRQGTLAEYAAVDECWLYSTPDGIDHETAAAGALVGITAHLGLFREADLQEGQVVFVNGGSGGVGSTVVQLGKAAGATVITTGGNDTKIAVCKELGADHVINYHKEGVCKHVKEFAPEGVHVWWDVTRHPDLAVAVDCLRDRGHIVIMAGREAMAELPVGPFYLKELRLSGFVMFKASPEEQQECATDINRWLADGSYKPRIDRVLPLDEAAEAHRLQHESTVGNERELAGKIVVTT